MGFSRIFPFLLSTLLPGLSRKETSGTQVCLVLLGEHRANRKFSVSTSRKAGLLHDAAKPLLPWIGGSAAFSGKSEAQPLRDFLGFVLFHIRAHASVLVVYILKLPRDEAEHFMARNYFQDQIN